jgi:putative ABC transport system ATP-binding protein
VNGTPAIITKQLGKAFQDGEQALWAVRGLDLEIQMGTFNIIMGPSGSGKSTLLHLLGGLDNPTEGSIQVGDFLINQQIRRETLAAYRRHKVGFVFQSFHLIPNMRVLENITLPLQLRNVPRLPREDRARILLNEMGLAHRSNHIVNTLSGGEKQRVAIARALINDPEIILADEPTGNLDTKTGDAIVKLLRELCDHAKTVVMVTHDERFNMHASRVIQIMDGKVID